MHNWSRKYLVKEFKFKRKRQYKYIFILAYCVLSPNYIGGGGGGGGEFSLGR